MKVPCRDVQSSEAIFIFCVDLRSIRKNRLDTIFAPNPASIMQSALKAQDLRAYEIIVTANLPSIVGVTGSNKSLATAP